MDTRGRRGVFATRREGVDRVDGSSSWRGTSGNEPTRVVATIIGCGTSEKALERAQGIRSTSNVGPPTNFKRSSLRGGIYSARTVWTVVFNQLHLARATAFDVNDGNANP